MWHRFRTAYSTRRETTLHSAGNRLSPSNILPVANDIGVRAQAYCQACGWSAQFGNQGTLARCEASSTRTASLIIQPAASVAGLTDLALRHEGIRRAEKQQAEPALRPYTQ